MAIKNYYVNTDTGSAGNPGTSPELAWASLRDYWTKNLDADGDEVTVWCSGNTPDVIPESRTAENGKFFVKLKIKGDFLSTDVVNGTGYTLEGSAARIFYIDQPLSYGFEFENIRCVTGTTVANSFIHGIRAGDILVKDCVFAVSKNLTATRIFYATPNSDGVFSSVKFVNCIVDYHYDTTDAGVGPFQFAGKHNIGLYNVTVNRPGPAGPIWRYIHEQNAGVPEHTVTAKNCVFMDSESGIVRFATNGSASALTLDSCLYSGAFGQPPVSNTNAIAVTGTGYAANVWQNAANGNYALLATADDVINTGVDVSAENGGITTDILGNPRVAPWDRGAEEFQSATPHPGIHEVQYLTHANDPNNIYYQQGVQIGDQFSYKETTETNGWGVDIDAFGYPIIDNGAEVGTDSFLFNIDKGSGWEPEPPASYTWTFSVEGPEPPPVGEGILRPVLSSILSPVVRSVL